MVGSLLCVSGVCYLLGRRNGKRRRNPAVQSARGAQRSALRNGSAPWLVEQRAIRSELAPRGGEQVDVYSMRTPVQGSFSMQYLGMQNSHASQPLERNAETMSLSFGRVTEAPKRLSAPDYFGFGG